MAGLHATRDSRDTRCARILAAAPAGAWSREMKARPAPSGYMPAASLSTHASPVAQLLTHNMLTSPGTRNGFPLAIEAEKVEEVEAEFNAEFMARMVEKLEYPALVATLACVSTHPARVLCTHSATPPTRPAPPRAHAAQNGGEATSGTARVLRGR